MKIRVYIQTYPHTKACDNSSFFVAAYPPTGDLIGDEKRYFVDVEVPEPENGEQVPDAVAEPIKNASCPKCTKGVVQPGHDLCAICGKAEVGP